MTAEAHNENSNRETIYQPGQPPSLHKVYNSIKLPWYCSITLTVSVWEAKNSAHLRKRETSKNCNLFCSKNSTVLVLGDPEGADGSRECILFSEEKKKCMVKKWREVSSKLAFKGTETRNFRVLKVGKIRKKDGTEHSVGMISFLSSPSPDSKKAHVWVVSQEFDALFTGVQQHQVIQEGSFQGFQFIAMPQQFADSIFGSHFPN